MATVRWVSDGDTIGADTADRREVQVRLIGIDAPETKKPGSPIECYGPEASAELVRLLPKGTVITAAYQKFRVDRYQRDLWDIWLSDGTFVQGHLVERGLARTQTFGGTNRDARYLAALQDRARLTKTGLWGACPTDG
jgi:micrococcal nuclease